MSRSRIGFIAFATASVLALTFQACGETTGENGNQSLSDPATFQATMTQKFLPMVAGVNDGLQRLLVAIAGGGADGVIIIPNATGADATVSVDFNGDGSREGSISGSFVGSIATGASLSITSIQTADPTLSGSGSTSVVETTPGMVLIDGMSGGGSADPPGDNNAVQVSVSSGQVALDVVTGVASGFVDFAVSGEGSSLSVTATFQPDGSGGFEVRFTGDGIDFTIP